MSAVMNALRSPGAMRETIGAPPSLFPNKQDSEESLPLESAQTYTLKAKSRALDRGLDHVVRASGSTPAFIFIQTLLVTWAFLGIPFNSYSIWPVIISDCQAVFSYVFDSFLMRQQLNGYYEGLDIAAELKSRNETKARMIRNIPAQVRNNIVAIRSMAPARELADIDPPHEGCFGRFITYASAFLGHIAFIIFYWICIFVWLGFGPAHDWSNEWQLDINSSTSALMIFVFSFLAILRERHADYLRSWTDNVYRLDSMLELKLRRLTGDEIPNQDSVIPSAKVNVVQRAINYYADVVGTLVGIALLLLVLISWLAVGPVLHFNANWWLFIGTYAGLVGLNDGFVLRNVQAKLREHEQPHYAALDDQDEAMLNDLGLELPEKERVEIKAISYRMSERMNRVCGHEITVIIGVVFIFGLLVGSSVMRWSETGQLLCNVPPSIIETFFMVILITGHNAQDKQRRADMANLFKRRRRLLAFVDSAVDFVNGRMPAKSG